MKRELNSLSSCASGIGGLLDQISSMSNTRLIVLKNVLPIVGSTPQPRIFFGGFKCPTLDFFAFSPCPYSYRQWALTVPGLSMEKIPRDSVLISVLLCGNDDRIRPGDERFKRLSNGVKEPVEQGPCHQTSDRQYRNHAYRRARSAMSVCGLSLPNRIPRQIRKKGETLDKFLALATRRRRR